MRTSRLSDLLRLIPMFALLSFNTSVFAQPTTNGNVIEVPDNGWYQVQRADNYQSICEGQRRCEMPPGEYIVINHTSGERFNISVSDSNQNNDVSAINVTGNLIQWPDDGWYQVQDASTYASLCEGGTRCEVPNGEYFVINHTNGQRDTVIVGQSDTNAFVTVVGNTIEWRDDGWYQVLNATNYEALCEGGRSCTVANGTYILINHTTGDRDNNVTVNGDSDVVQPVITPPVFDLVAPQILPARCIGSIDDLNTRFCVNPDTRLFSATREDGSVQWSYTLPGTNASNQIESVLTTDQWLIIVADKFPELDEMTLEQRGKQYEASLFNKNGGYIRTVPLGIDLRANTTPASGFVNSGYSSGATNNRLNAIAAELANGDPLLVIGWNRWQAGNASNEWDLGGVTAFNLTSGTQTGNVIYPDMGIKALSLLKGDRDIVRVVSEDSVFWYHLDNFQFVHPSHFSQFAKDAAVRALGSVDSQLNGSNYQDVITRVLPWINGDYANEILFGRVTNEPPINFSIPFSSFSLLSEFTDENYNNKIYLCTDGGEMLLRPHRYVSIDSKVFDYCAFADKTYQGKLHSNYVLRDGFGVRAENLTVYRSNGAAATANLEHGVSYSRVLSGSSRGYGGSVAGYGDSVAGKNISVANYESGADFFYGPSPGTEVCAYEMIDNQIVHQLYCKRYSATGSIHGSMVLNADWTSYSSLRVKTDLNFGQNYHSDFDWISASGSSLPDPIPFDGRTEPLKDFYFESGSIKITAQDNSRIELTPIAQPGEPAFDVKVYDPSGNDLGNFPMEFLNVKCAERLSTCTVP